MIDKYGWITSRDKITGEPRDYGDSCFFMALRALLYLLQGNVKEIKELYSKAAAIDFLRHPKVLEPDNSYYKTKNQTSYDMMMIWDLIAYRYGFAGKDNYMIKPPRFHRRNSKFLSGRYRCKLMYNPIFMIIIATILNMYLSLIKLLIKKHQYKLADKLKSFFFKDKFHKLHILIIYLAICYDIIQYYVAGFQFRFWTKHNRLRPIIDLLVEFHYKPYTLFAKLLLQPLVYKIEDILGYQHHFFRFLFYMPITNLEPRPVHNSWEWIYQRDLSYMPRHPEADKIEFHCEVINGECLDLSEMFYKFEVLPAYKFFNE